LIFCPATVVGSSAAVFFSGMPSDAAGPVADTEMPTLMSAQAGAAAKQSAIAAAILCDGVMLVSSLVVVLL